MKRGPSGEEGKRLGAVFLSSAGEPRTTIRPRTARGSKEAGSDHWMAAFSARRNRARPPLRVPRCGRARVVVGRSPFSSAGREGGVRNPSASAACILNMLITPGHRANGAGRSKPSHKRRRGRRRLRKLTDSIHPQTGERREQTRPPRRLSSNGSFAAVIHSLSRGAEMGGSCFAARWREGISPPRRLLFARLPSARSSCCVGLRGIRFTSAIHHHLQCNLLIINVKKSYAKAATYLTAKPPPTPCPSLPPPPPSLLLCATGAGCLVRRDEVPRASSAEHLDPRLP
jgi:hypothetical protein